MLKQIGSPNIKLKISFATKNNGMQRFALQRCHPTGHALNNKLLCALQAHLEAWEFITIEDVKQAPSGSAPLARAGKRHAAGSPVGALAFAWLCRVLAFVEDAGQVRCKRWGWVVLKWALFSGFLFFTVMIWSSWLKGLYPNLGWRN
jgi:hypothetical protein